MVDLHQLHGGAIHLDEYHANALAWAVRCDDDVSTMECRIEVVDLECHMRDALDELRIGRVRPVALPLKPEWIVRVVAHRNLQMRQIDFSFETRVGGNANVMELQHDDGPRVVFSHG